MSKSGVFREENDELNRIRQEAMEFADIGLYRYTFDGIMLFMDRSALKILELDGQFDGPDAVAGKDLAELVVYAGPQGEMRAEVRMHRLVRGREWAFKTLKGTKKWVVEDSYLVDDAKTGQQAIQVVIRDITEQKRSEKASRESERQFLETLERVHVIAAQVDNETRITFCNDYLLSLTGWRREELIGENWFERLVPPEVNKDVAGSFLKQDGLSDDFPSYYENPILTSGGEPLFISWSNFPIRDQAGKVVGLTCIGQDFTERKLAQEALRDSEERYRELFENANDIVYTHDLSGRFTSLNKAGERVTGYTREEAFKLNAIEILVPEHRDLALTMIKRKLAGDELTRYELDVVGKEGQRVPLEVSTKVVFTAGRPVGIQGIARDITERKRADDKRKELEAQIRHTQKLEGLGVLAGGIAHDFNNLLVGILGNAGLALMRLDARSSARSYVEKVEDTAQRAAVLTNQMLAYSGKATFVVQPLDLSKLAEEMGNLLSAAISKKAILKYNCATGLPLIEGDAAQLQQVVMNLITNASDAIGEDSGVITLSTSVVNANQGYLSKTYLDDDLAEGFYVCLEVSDTGDGMDEETQARIFDPFFSTKFAGRGLGLAAVLGIVRGHRGAINVYSEPGHGTMFKVMFPAAKIGEKRSEIEPMSDPSPGLETWRSSGTVLIADDEESVRNVAKETLEERGFTAITAVDGRDALGLFRERADEIVAVLLDLTMPVMNGEQTFNKIQEIRKDVPIILSSGYSEQDAVERFSGKEPAAFIQKPYAPKELIRVFRNVLTAD